MAQRPRPTRWPRPVVFAVLGALLLAGVAAAFLTFRGGEPSESGAMPSGAAAASQSASSLAGPGPLAEGQLYWVAADVAPQPVGAYRLQGGTLEQRLIDMDVPFVTPQPPRTTLTPAISQPRGGSFVYVADDGTTSEIRLATLSEPTTDVLVAEIDEIVWDIDMSHDRTTAYMLLVRRDLTGDAGVARVGLGGGAAEPEPILDAAQPPPADGGGGDLSTAFIGDLMISPDGRHLLRRTCPELGQPCAVGVADLASGDVIQLPDRPAFGIADGFVFGFVCDQAECRAVATDLANGEERNVGTATSAVAVSGADGPTVVYWVGDERGLLLATDVLTGENRAFSVPPAGVEVHSPELSSDLRIEAPEGWVIVTILQPDGRQLLAVRASGFDVVQLPDLPREVPSGSPEG